MRPWTNPSGRLLWQEGEEEPRARWGGWSWWIRIYVAAAAQRHIAAHYVEPFMKWWGSHCSRVCFVWLCVWGESIIIKIVLSLLCSHSPVNSSHSSWRPLRFGSRWAWRTETLQSNSPSCCRYARSHTDWIWSWTDQLMVGLSPWTGGIKPYKDSKCVLVFSKFGYLKKQFG